MARTRKIRIAIRNVLEPHLEAQGFVGKHPHFRRHENGCLDLLSVLYDKWGGGFVLEFCRQDAGPFTTAWGEVIPEYALDVAYVPAEQRARLIPITSTEDFRNQFFRYEDFADDKQRCEALVTQAVGLFPQVNAWLRDKAVGPNLSPYAPEI